MYLPIKPCCRTGAGWASAGKRGADADHACAEEVLPGGDQHAGWGVQLALGRHWCGLWEAAPVDTNRIVSDKLKCYILTRRGNNNLFVMVFWFLHSMQYHGFFYTILGNVLPPSLG